MSISQILGLYLAHDGNLDEVYKDIGELVMGAFWRGIPPDLLTWGASRLGSKSVALETGTYLGDGASLLSKHFSKVFTIERDEALAANATRRFVKVGSVKVLQGSSRDMLIPNMPARDTPAFFWLDAHFSGGVTAGADDPCPLEFELSSICEARDVENTIILIDDVRGAVGANGWPSVTEISGIASRHGFQGVIVDDVFVLAHHDHFEEIPKIAGQSRAVELAGKSAYWGTMQRVIKILNLLESFLNSLKIPLARVKRIVTR